MEAQLPMVRLTVVHGSFSAHVLAARLADEGFDVQLRGSVDGPYAVTVGDLARVDVYVPADQVDDARLVLLDLELDAATADVTADRDAQCDHAGAPPEMRWLVWGLVALAVAPFVRLIFMGG